MAGQGRAPQATRSRKRDTEARSAETEVLVATGRARGPALPKNALPDGEDWHPQTRQLWDALRRDPILAEETPVGWQFLLDTMLMHHTMWAKGRWEFASEVRLRLAKYGATPEDRMRLKVRVERPKSEKIAPSPDADTPAATRRRGLHIAG